MGGKKEKLLLEKAERVDEPFQIHHKKCLVLHLMSRSLGRFDGNFARSV